MGRVKLASFSPKRRIAYVGTDSAVLAAIKLKSGKFGTHTSHSLLVPYNFGHYVCVRVSLCICVSMYTHTYINTQYMY